jgi:CRP-like cAMP-binding protein
MDAVQLEGLTLFAGLSKRERARVAQLADEIDLPAGRKIVNEGAFAYELFVIEDGTAEVRRHDTHLADLGPGDFFGEMGVMAQGSRNASVVTTSPMTAVVMTAHDFRRVAQEMPSVANRIRATIEERAKTLIN